MTPRRPRVFGLVQWVCASMAFFVGVFAVPLGAIDARDHRAAVALEADGTWHDVRQVREHVVRSTSRTTVSYGVDRVEVTYDGGVVLVRGLRSPPAPEQHEGWYVTYRASPGQPAERVRVGRQGAFLEDDYEHVLHDPDRSVETGFVVWVVVWSALLVLTTVVRRRRQLAAGHEELSPARVLAVKTVAGVVAVVLALFLFSFLLEHLTYPR